MRGRLADAGSLTREALTWGALTWGALTRSRVAGAAAAGRRNIGAPRPSRFASGGRRADPQRPSLGQCGVLG